MKHDRKKIILMLLALVQLLVVVDTAIVNVALPAIKQALGFSDASLQWVLTAYILTFGGFLMLGGRAADLFGRRRILVAGTVGFTTVSLLLGLAPNGPVLIALRAVQGLAAAFMTPAALSILLTTFPEGAERNKALSFWSVVASGGAALGVFLGGLLTQYLGWRANFFVNVPIGIVAALGLIKYLPPHIKESRDHTLDLPGAVLITAGLMALVYALTQAPQTGFTGGTLAALVASAGLIGAFLWNETRAKHPLMPLSIFRIRNVSGGNLIMVPIMAGALGLFYFCSLYVQNVLHYSPIMSGLGFLPIPIIIGYVSTKAPHLLGRFGFKPLMVVGITLVAAGTFMLSFLTADSAYLTHLLPAFVMMGIGFGLSFVAITVAATSGVPSDEAGLASGLISTSQQVGGALGIAALAVVASSTTATDRSLGQSLQQASLHGYQQAFLWAAILVVIALAIATFMIRTPKLAPTPVPVEA